MHALIYVYISVRIDCKITLTTKGSMKDARSFFPTVFLTAVFKNIKIIKLL